MNIKNKMKTFFKDSDTRSSLFLYLILPIIINIILESFQHRSIFGGFIKLAAHPYIFLCNALIILLTFSVTLLLRKRFFWITLLTVVWLGFGVANYVLLCNRVTPFTSCDLYLIDSIFSVIQKYFNGFQIILILILCAAIGAGLVILFFKAPKTKNKINYIRSTILIIIICSLNYGAIQLGTASGALESQFTELSKAYLRNGFVYCFTDGLVNTGVAKPEDYSSETIFRIAANDKLSNANVKPKSTPNIVMVQLESFFDITCAKDLTFSKSPIPNFQKLAAKGGSGLLSVPVVGAGTVNSEFEVMTGMNIDDFGAGEYPFKTILKSESCESLAFNLKTHGYTSHVLHNNTGRFYSRNIVYGNLGFDDFTSVEYMNGYDTTITGWAKDACLTSYIMDCLENTKKQDLVYTISVQGHGGYSVSQPYTKHLSVTSIKDEAMRGQIEYYANQLYETDLFIADLVSALKKYKEDTILVLYGDHLPSLDFTDDNLNGRTIYQTDYVIWNNMGLKFQDADLQANQLSPRILKKLNIKDGVINSYHQNHDTESTFYEGLAALEYDMLYGDQLVYNGKSPYKPNNMKLSLTTVNITNVIPDDFLDGYVIIRGNYFTPYSKVYINDEKITTEFINDKTLRIQYDELKPSDIVTVWQSKLSSTEPYKYDTIEMKKVVPDEDDTTDNPED
ncbi:MAG: LTA synthase family protein [Lachnospiraceae bacterium]